MASVSTLGRVGREECFGSGLCFTGNAFAKLAFVKSIRKDDIWKRRCRSSNATRGKTRNDIRLKERCNPVFQVAKPVFQRGIRCKVKKTKL